jgi:hypothetical protein
MNMKWIVISIRLPSVRLIVWSVLLALLMAIMAVSVVKAQSGGIVLDGEFSDWDGQASVADPQGDSHTAHTDIKTFYFATNPDEEYLYFMAERWNTGAESVVYSLAIDTNNDGVYTDASDRRIEVIYNPSRGSADVALYDGVGGFLSQIADNQSWGEGKKGRYVEWGVSFADLGILPHQTLRLQLFSMQGGNVSDGVSEVQWSPADALGWLLVPLALGGIAYLYFRRKPAK